MIKQAKRRLQFNFLPYIYLREDLTIGNVVLWPFYRKEKKYVRDQNIRSQIKKFLRQYVGNFKPRKKRRKPLKSITIVSYNSPYNFKQLNKKQSEEIRDVVTILSFCAIIRNDITGAFSSDDFQLVRQNFILGDDGIATSYGSFVRRNNLGWKIDEVIFVTPLYINQECTHQGRCLGYDEKILRALESLQQDKNNQELYRRIITSLEWVLYACPNVDNFDRASRIVMMATAFEILLGRFRNRFKFMEKIRKLTCDSLDNTKSMRSTRTINFEGKQEKKNFSLKEWWAYEFYDLRSRIVHGKETNPKDFKNRKRKEYFSISIRFFEECLKKILSSHNYYAYDSDIDPMLWARIYDEI